MEYTYYETQKIKAQCGIYFWVFIAFAVQQPAKERKNIYINIYINVYIDAI